MMTLNLIFKIVSSVTATPLLDKIMPALITGGVAMIIFFGTSWRDRVKEAKEKKNERREKMDYLEQLLVDAVDSTKKQIAGNQSYLEKIQRNLYTHPMFSLGPTFYLQRLSNILADDSYFTAFNTSFRTIDAHKRVSNYSEITFVIDGFTKCLAEIKDFADNICMQSSASMKNYEELTDGLLREIVELEEYLVEKRPEYYSKQIRQLSNSLQELPKNKLGRRGRIDVGYRLEHIVAPTFRLLEEAMDPDLLNSSTGKKIHNLAISANDEYHEITGQNARLVEYLLETNIVLILNIERLNSGLEIFRR